MEKLGINWIQFVAQLVNVGILIVVLKKFLFKPILKILESRRQTAEELERKESELSKRLEDLTKKEQEIMRKAKYAADQTLKDAQKEAKKLRSDVLKNAEQQAKRQQLELLKEAELTVAREKEDLKKVIREEAVKLANEAVQKLLPEDAHLKITETQLIKFLKHS